MAKFKESDLSENLKEFENKTTIEIEFEKSIDGKATIKYDEKRGFINIENKDSNFKINTTLVYGYLKTEEEIQIDLETILLKIKRRRDY